MGCCSRRIIIATVFIFYLGTLAYFGLRATAHDKAGQFITFSSLLDSFDTEGSAGAGDDDGGNQTNTTTDDSNGVMKVETKTKVEVKVKIEENEKSESESESAKMTKDQMYSLIDDDATHISIDEKVEINNALSKFHRWDDKAGIDINNLILYYEWFSSKGIHDPAYGLNGGWLNWVNIPFIITKEPNGSINVKISQTSYNLIPKKHFFRRYRIVPMIKLMMDGLNQYHIPSNHTTLDQEIGAMSKHRSPPRHDLSRIYQLLDGGFQIPFLYEISDESRCGSNATRGATLTTVDQALQNMNMPIFSLARGRECQFSFPTPTYLEIEHSRQNSSQWDPYFMESASKYSWETKINAAVWRGTNSGAGRNEFNREWLEEIGRRVENGTLINVYITDHHSMKKIPFDDFQKYKAIIDIDGNGWSGRFQRLLCMNSVIIKVKPGWVDYNMGYNIKPWVHYIPAEPYGRRGDYNSSLPDVVRFVNAPENEDKVKNIIANAQSWCRENLTYETMKEDALDIFASYVEELDRNNTKWEEVWKQKSNSSFEDALKYDNVD